MNIAEFDKKVLKSCGRTTLREQALTGYHSYGSMDQSYNQLYKDPTIQRKFGGGYSNDEPRVFLHSNQIGAYIPPIFGDRQVRLTNIGSSVN